MDRLGEIRESTKATRCLVCGKCSTLCPLAARGEFTARLLASFDGAEVAERVEGIEHCLTCSSCESRCPQGVRFAEYVRGLREVTAGASDTLPPHDGVFQSVARSMAGNGSPHRDHDWESHGLTVAEEGEVALFVGCLPYFDLYFGESLGLRTMDIARAAVRILNHVGISPVIVREERCCGHDLLWGGDRASFESLARANAEEFRKRGVKHILTTCAECCRTWRIDYAEAVSGSLPRVQHMSEFLAERVRAGDLALREEDGPTAVTFQDPCRLGRHLDVVDAPREVLRALPGLEMHEMSHAGRDAVCCGTSGFIHCDTASRELQERRLSEAKGTGAGTLVTACPKCLIHFSCARAGERRSRRKETEIQIEDFTVLAARWLEDGERERKAPAPSKGRKTGES